LSNVQCKIRRFRYFSFTFHILSVVFMLHHGARHMHQDNPKTGHNQVPVVHLHFS